MAEPGTYHKTRIAPTPSGFLHIGNVLSFAVTVALAKQSGAKILLRIDDIDQARADKQYVQDIFDTLNFLEIPWSEGPRDITEFEARYSQMHRIGLYNQALQQLQDDGLVYACDCSRKQLQENICQCKSKQLPLNAVDVCWRLITPAESNVVVRGLNGELIEANLPLAMADFVVRKKDGFPAYQLTSVIDDLYYGVDLVVRGEDLWPSTLAQHQLANALGRDDFKQITFYHHPLIINGAGNKLSKSAGAASIKYLREQGESAGYIYNFIGSRLKANVAVNNWGQLASLMLKK